MPTTSLLMPVSMRYAKTVKASAGCLVPFQMRKVSASTRPATFPSRLIGMVPNSNLPPALVRSPTQHRYQDGMSTMPILPLAKLLPLSKSALPSTAPVGI